MMFHELSSSEYLLVFLIILLAAFILIVLLPTLWELKRPRDAGPRKII